MMNGFVFLDVSGPIVLLFSPIGFGLLILVIALLIFAVGRARRNREDQAEQKNLEAWLAQRSDKRKE